MPLTPEEKKRRAKNARLLSRYGITIEMWEAIFEAQGRMCPVCLGTDKIFCVDHNHKTLKIRGIVCSNCNLRVIGGARDQDYKLVNAAEYVTNNPADMVYPEGLYLEKNPAKTRRRRRVTRRRRIS